MSIPDIVIDTNVIVAGLRSRNGAAFQLLTLVGRGQFHIHLSVPLVLEYEDVLIRNLPSLAALDESDVQNIINFHCAVATHHPIFFLWRPYLRDAKDDMILELAVKAGCDSVVTYNIRDFAGIEQFGISAVPPAAFLKSIGTLP
jgi:putative PIN family toxin of toxin-antitoxin system